MFMRYRAGKFIFLFFITFALLIPFAGAVKEEGSKTVDIDNPFELDAIEFDHGDKLHLEASIEAAPSPISVLLLKGETAYNAWIESESFDIEEIKSGKNVSGMNISVEVIDNFSQINIMSFNEKIDIGEQDTYYLVIALHRDSSMEPNEVLSMASMVHYDIEWKIEEKDVPWGLLILAAFFLLAGAGFLTAYFISRRRYLSEIENEEEDRHTERRNPAPRDPHIERRRAPPMR
jgi:hypothetical protein